MPYAFYYDAPGNAHIYEQVTARLGEPPQGMLAAVVTETDSGLRHLNVWESREQWEAFRNGRLRSVVTGVLTDLAIPIPTTAPEEHVLPLVDVVLPTAGAAS